MTEYRIEIDHNQKAALETFLLDYIRQPNAMDVYTNAFSGNETTPMQLLRLVRETKEEPK